MRGAKAVRRDIKRSACAGLAVPPAAQAGFYVFIADSDVSISQIQYIGIAKTTNRPISGRIIDRLRDDSALDTALDNLEDGKFREVVSRRLLTALPKSGQNYIEMHLAAA